ncbi:MAG TPA: hypothetical protein VE398_24330 [Acidobacteriota bacterium]|nr:hypothetical protein [Acidobacteriota bacterium]
MPWFNTQVHFRFDRPSILSNAPVLSGVYGLFRTKQWIYFGESENMQQSLLEHVDGDNPDILKMAPTHFTFEVWSGNKRIARQNQLIQEFRPVCNQRLG